MTGWPRLDGEIRVDDVALGAAAEDFGHIVHRRPRAVVAAGSVEDVVRVVGHCRDQGIQVAPRGQGHTAFGQAQVADGVVLDLRALSGISVADSSATVGAGARWDSAAHATLRSGLIPPVLPDHLGLSVGGTLSVGGISGTSFHYGAQVDNVAALTVVTGTAELVTCSEDDEFGLFEAVLAGLGQCGIIVEAEVRLVDATPAVHVFRLPYADLGAMVADLHGPALDGRFEYAQGIVAPRPEGGWDASIEAAAPAPGPPGPADALDGLHHTTGAETTEPTTRWDWTNRVAERVAALRMLGLWTHPHPWLDLFVPGSAVDAVLPEILASPSVDSLEPLRILVYPLRPSLFRRPLLRLPEEETAVLVDVLSIAPADAAGARAATPWLESNRRLFERTRRLGGTVYPIGAVPLDHGDWTQHFGPRWDQLVKAKQRFDPAAILSPGPGIF